MRPRAGSVLLEILLSIAIFLAAAGFTLGAARSVIHGLDRAHRHQQMMDLARTRMAELETGLVTIAELREDALRDADDFVVDVGAERTEFSGLSLVELSVRDPGADGRGGPSVTLRQLVALHPPAPTPYERDPMLDGLPETPAGPEPDAEPAP